MFIDKKYYNNYFFVIQYLYSLAVEEFEELCFDYGLELDEVV